MYESDMIWLYNVLPAQALALSLVKQAFLWDQENIPLARPTQSHPADIAWMPRFKLLGI